MTKNILMDWFRYSTSSLPADSLVAEDGVSPYVAEDGATFYVAEY